MPAATLFDRSEAVTYDDLGELPRRIGRSALLWLDVERDEARVREAVEAVGGHHHAVRCLLSGSDEPSLVDGDSWTLVSAQVPMAQDHRTELRRVDCVVGERWVLTVHDRPVPALEDFRERAMGSGATGKLDGPSFLAMLLEWVLGEYARAFEEIETELEELDVRALEGDLADPEHGLRRLVGIRQDVGELRRHLAGHREALVALTHPELDALSSEQSARRFRALVDRLDVTLQAARDAREATVGSFDILMARTEHRTNEILKILTLASVLFLPGSLIAAILGMNFKVPLFENTALFWIVVGAVAGIIGATAGAARLRHWV